MSNYILINFVVVKYFLINFRNTYSNKNVSWTKCLEKNRNNLPFYNDSEIEVSKSATHLFLRNKHLFKIHEGVSSCYEDYNRNKVQAPRPHPETHTDFKWYIFRCNLFSLGLFFVRCSLPNRLFLATVWWFASTQHLVVWGERETKK